MQIKGNIKFIGQTQTFGNNGFRKRELVVTTDEQYPQHILVEFTQDKCDLLNDKVVGQGATVSINLRGREWTNPQGETKYFNSIQGWRIEADPIPAQSQPQQQAQPQAQAPEPPLEPEDHDDLPF